MAKTKAGTKWPKGEPRPITYNPRRRLYPCKKCNSYLLANGSQAVIVEKRTADFAIMYCKVCEYHFHLDREKYSFQRNPKCEECNGKTIKTSTQGNIQYRKCEECGHQQKSIGVKGKKG